MAKIPSLGYALLGLIEQKPASGYDLRKIFSSTSMKYYSDSPGAIYPALGRLEQQGLLRGTIDIASKAKAGTEITLRIPLAASEH